MPMQLHEPFVEPIQPVFDVLPFDRAMHRLVVERSGGGHPEAAAVVDEAVRAPALAERPDLIAGLWLYVDELEKSHDASQHLDTPTGAYWHAVMHRREGDFSNAKHWLRRAVNHPAMAMIDLTGGGAGSGTSVAAYDPTELVDRVEAAHSHADPTHPELVSAQCKEWKALFGWCLKQ